MTTTRHEAGGSRTGARRLLVALGLVALAVVVAVALAGRGGGDDTAREPAAPPSTTPPQPSQDDGTAAESGDVLAWGAVPDDGEDDTASIQRALDSMVDGGTLVFPAGTYEHRDLLVVAHADVHLEGEPGAVLHATEPTRQALTLEGDRTGISGMTLTSTAVTRLVNIEHHRIVLDGGSLQEVRDVVIDGGSAAGIFVHGAEDYEITDNVVQNTLADAIHNTYGSRRGLVARNQIVNSGDDCVAVVSYVGDDRISGDIVVEDNSCIDSHARGYTVVGGERVRIASNYVEHSRAAGIYLASEPSFNTYAATDVSVIDNTIVRANHDGSLAHGAILVYGREGTATSESAAVTHPLQNRDIVLQGNRIVDTIGGPAHVSVNNQYTERIRIVDTTIEGDGDLEPILVAGGVDHEIVGTVVNGQAPAP